MSEVPDVSATADVGFVNLGRVMSRRPARGLSRPARRVVSPDTVPGEAVAMACDATDLPTELTPLLTEALTQLRPILMPLGLAVSYRAADGRASRLVYTPSATPCSAQSIITSPVAVSAPLVWPDGTPSGSLEYVCTQPLPSDALTFILEPLLQQVARSLSESWFRLQRRASWIVAAAPLSNPDRGLLLALDLQMRLQAVALDATEGFGPGASGQPVWEAFFLPMTPVPSVRAGADATLRLTSARDGKPWVAVLTAPNFLPSQSSNDVLRHVRPRLPQLPAVRVATPRRSRNVLSLTVGARRRVEEYVEAHLEQPLSVALLAKVVGLSGSYFSRSFHNAFNVTPHRYVMLRRLARAQKLILESEASLAEVAIDTGFADQSHMCRFFRCQTGESPSRFRRRHR